MSKEILNVEREVIEELNVREQCRLKLPMWYGSRDNYYHGVRECLANGSDEITTNFKEGQIIVELLDDNQTISITDTGRGINIGDYTNGEPNYTKLFSKLFTGTNYRNLERGKTNTGANGCGTCVLNQTSLVFEVTSFYNNKKHIVRFENGGELISYNEYERKDDDMPHGSIFKFKLDPDVYTETTFDINELIDIVDKLASTTNVLTCYTKYNGEEKEFHYDSHLEYLEIKSTGNVSKLLDLKAKTFSTKVKDEISNSMLMENDTFNLCIALSTEPFQETYLNGTYLKDKGSIHDGVIEGIRKFLNKQNKKYKFTYQDVEMSFSFYGNMLSTNAEYTNQTKFSTSKKVYKDLIINYIQDEFEIVKSEQPKLIEQMTKHLEVINNANKKTEESRKKISKELKEKATVCTTRPKKFVPCRSKNPKEISFGVLEGDSAEGTVKLARDSKTMCFLPLKGKPLNCFKASLNDILNNDEIIATFQILGCGMSYFGKPIKGIDKFNIDNLQVSEYLIINDQDDDGLHLQALCIGNMYVLAPELIKAGVIKALITPLYIIKTKDEEIWAYDEAERSNIVNKLKQDNIKFKEQRFKGLGGLSVEAMSKCLDKETRKCYTITMEDAEECIKYLELFLGDDVEPRKEYIMAHAHEYEVEKYYD